MLFPSLPPSLVSVTKNEHETGCHGHFYWMAEDSEFFFGVCIYVLSNRKLKNYTNKVQRKATEMWKDVDSVLKGN